VVVRRAISRSGSNYETPRVRRRRNIAEGFQRYNPSQFAQFMNIAKGSLAETQNHLLHGKHQGYFSEQEFTDAWRLTCRALRAANRLHAYLRSCGKRSEPGRTP
jgi:hypothetical protein